MWGSGCAQRTGVYSGFASSYPGKELDGIPGGEYDLGPQWDKDDSRKEAEEEEVEVEMESELEETKMPPAMRTRWIHQELETLRSRAEAGRMSG